MSLVVGGGLCRVRVCPVGAVLVGWGWVGRVADLGGSWWVGDVGLRVGWVEGPWGFVLPEGLGRSPWGGSSSDPFVWGDLTGGLWVPVCGVLGGGLGSV
jgi:hypothetical protein